MDAAKFEVGQEDRVGGSLASVDKGLGKLPSGYGESRIVLMPHDPQWAYTYWDLPNEHKEELRRQGGQQLALRLYDVTDINLEYEAHHNVQEYLCDELAREWYLPIPVSDRDYVVDIGYRCADGRWLSLARSATVRIPPEYPSDWDEEHFITVNFDEDLRGKTVFKLGSPTKSITAIHDEIFSLSQSAEEQRVTGSLFGSMHQLPISSFVFPSGMGMSGVGFSASMPPLKPRPFWLVADAELIIHGATEPDATVTIGDRQIQLNPDGTFRFQMSFQDGTIDYPIMAVAADGKQTRSIHMNFTRETPERRTNTEEEAERDDLKQIRIPEGWESIKEIKNQVLREVDRLKKLDKLPKEQWSREGYDENEFLEVQRDYELFLSQEEVVQLISLTVEDFQQKVLLEGRYPSESEIFDAMMPILLEATAREENPISIPQNPKLQKVLAMVTKKTKRIIESTKAALQAPFKPDSKDDDKKPKGEFGSGENKGAGNRFDVPRPGAKT